MGRFTKRILTPRTPPVWVADAVVVALQSREHVDTLPLLTDDDLNDIRVPTGHPPPAQCLLNCENRILGLRTNSNEDVEGPFAAEAFYYDFATDSVACGASFLPLPEVTGARHYDIRFVYAVAGVSDTGWKQWTRWPMDKVPVPDESSTIEKPSTREELPEGARVWDDVISAIGDCWRYYVAHSGTEVPESNLEDPVAFSRWFERTLGVRRKAVLSFLKPWGVGRTWGAG